VLKGTRRYQKIWEHYRPLYDAAITARYYCGADPGAWISMADAKSLLVERHLYGLEKSVLRLLGRSDHELPKLF
jgi:hypothetical protein